MRKIIRAFLLAALVLCCLSCSQNITPNNGNIVVQGFHYLNTGDDSSSEIESLGIVKYVLNGSTFYNLPYAIYNLPGNQTYHYDIEAYDADDRLMASGSGDWFVIPGATTTQVAVLAVQHLHTFKDAWSNDEIYHWHESDCGHSVIDEKFKHIFNGDFCTVCGYDKHVHTYSSSWSSDDYSHWHESDCGHSLTKDSADHIFGPDTVVIEPTCVKYGRGSHTCTICGKTVNYSIPKTEVHVFNEDKVCTVCGLHETTGLYVFYDKGSYSDGWRYLEAAPRDIRIVDDVPTVDSSLDGYSTAPKYYVFGFYLTSDNGSALFVNGTTTYNSSDCTGTAIGSGKNNTQLLVNAMGTEAYSGSGSDKTENYAARLCDELTYTIGGVTYDDWFLPSRDELNLMFTNLYKTGLGSFTPCDYWCSSEGSYSVGDSAWKQSFFYANQYRDSGYQECSFRFNSCAIRAVRAF